MKRLRKTRRLSNASPKQGTIPLRPAQNKPRDMRTQIYFARQGADPTFFFAVVRCAMLA